MPIFAQDGYSTLSVSEKHALEAARLCQGKLITIASDKQARINLIEQRDM